MVKLTVRSSVSEHKELTRILWNPKVCRRVHNSQPLDPIIKQNNPDEAHSSCFLKINFNIILQCTPRSSKRSVSFRHPHLNSGRNSSPSYRPHAPTWFILLGLTTRIVFVDKYKYEASNYAVSSTCLFTHSP